MVPDCAFSKFCGKAFMREAGPSTTGGSYHSWESRCYVTLQEDLRGPLVLVPLKYYFGSYLAWEDSVQILVQVRVHHFHLGTFDFI